MYRIIIIFLLFLGNSYAQEVPKSATSADKDVEVAGFLLALDTVKMEHRKASIEQFIQHIYPKPVQDTGYQLLKIKLLQQEKKSDSLSYYLEQLRPLPQEQELAMIAFLETSQFGDQWKRLAPHQAFKTMIEKTKEAERLQVRSLYKFYESLAKYCYLNHDYAQSKQFLDLYLGSCPFRRHPRIEQRYYDILCMIALTEKNLEDFQKYYMLAVPLAKKINEPYALNRLEQFEAEYYKLTGKNLQSLTLMRKSYHKAQKNEEVSPPLLVNMAGVFLSNKQYDSALYYSKEAIRLSKQHFSDTIPPASYYWNVKEAYRLKGDYQNAYYALDTMYQLSLLREKQVQHEKSQELLSQFESERKDFEIKNLRISNQLNEKTISQQKMVIITIILLIIIIAIASYLFYKRHLLKAHNKQLVAENKQLHLSQQLRQQQLNPHFIYNAIANLQGLIHTEQTQIANDYLITFSHYVRKMLELNREEVISLREEIDALTSYVKLQQMRYPNRFEFFVHTELDTDLYMIPPMLLQPFVENAIEHGFQHITYKGILSLTLEEKNDKLHITLTDNGRGESLSNPHKQSLSQTITQERLDLLFNQSQKDNAYFTATALKAPEKGYCVELIIPIL